MRSGFGDISEDCESSLVHCGYSRSMQVYVHRVVAAFFAVINEVPGPSLTPICEKLVPVSGHLEASRSRLKGGISKSYCGFKSAPKPSTLNPKPSSSLHPKDYSISRARSGARLPPSTVSHSKMSTRSQDSFPCGTTKWHNLLDPSGPNS